MTLPLFSCQEYVQVALTARIHPAITLALWCDWCHNLVRVNDESYLGNDSTTQRYVQQYYSKYGLHIRCIPNICCFEKQTSLTFGRCPSL